MNFTYENQGANTYLVYTVAPTDTVDEISLGMLTNNHIPALLPTTFTQMDAERRIRYNVTTKISAKEFLLGLVNAKRLCGVFLGVTEAFLAAEEYMLEWGSLLLDTEYIFSDVTTSETQMICFPIRREAAPVDPKAFFKTVLSGIQCDQTESTDYYARIMTYLNSPTFSLAEFKNLLENILATRGAAPAPKVAPAPQPMAAPAAAPTPMATPVARPAAPATAPAPQPAPQPAAAATPKYAVSGVFDGPVAPPPAPKAPKAPKADPVSIPTPQPAAAPAQDGEEISLMYLLQHYNKENAAAYKAQKAAKKGAPAPAAPAAPKAPTAPAQGSAYATSGVFDFDVPGVEKPIAPAAPAAPATSVATGAGKFNVVGVFDTPAAPAKGQYKTAGVFDTPAAPAAPKTAPKAPDIPIPSAPAPAPAPQPAPTPAPQPAPMPTSGLDFGGTVMVSAPNMDGTVVLDRPAASASPYLVRVRTQQRVRIDRPLIRIGREKSYADYCIPENPAISHSHANIISRDGKCYVMDTNSRNHTYVNGVMLQSHTETELHDGDKVRFANEDFEFKVF